VFAAACDQARMKSTLKKRGIMSLQKPWSVNAMLQVIYNRLQSLQLVEKFNNVSGRTQNKGI